MRLVAVLATLILAASAWYAPTIRAGKTASFAASEFAVSDPAERVRIGKKERALGIQLAGYDELINGGSKDPAHRLGRIRIGILLGAAVDAHKGLGELVQAQIRDYIEHRETIDPDGSFIRELMRDWIRLKTQNPDHFYQRVAVLIFRAAAGEKDALTELLKYNERGPFYSQFFPFVRSHFLRWNVVEPFVKYQLERLDDKDIYGFVEASYTLLLYESIFGVGTELLDSNLDEIRDAMKTVYGRLARPDPTNRLLIGAGVSVLRGMTILALRGDRDFRKILIQAEPVEMPYHLEYLAVAKTALGPLPRPGQREFDGLEPELQTFLFRIAAVRAGLIRRALGSNDDPALADQLDAMLKFVRVGYQTAAPLARGPMLLMLCKVGTDADRARIDEALVGGNIPALVASSLKRPEDPIRLMLPAINSPLTWPGALAAVSISSGNDAPLFQD